MDLRFREQYYEDTEAALERLFGTLPEIDAIRFRVLHPDTGDEIISGVLARADMVEKDPDAAPRTRLWQMGIRV